MIVLVINALLQVYPAWASIIGAPAPPPISGVPRILELKGSRRRGVWGGGIPLPRFFCIFLFKIAYFDAF